MDEVVEDINAHASKLRRIRRGEPPLRDQANLKLRTRMDAPSTGAPTVNVGQVATERPGTPTKEPRKEPHHKVMSAPHVEAHLSLTLGIPHNSFPP